MPGRLTIIVGLPGSGKSHLLQEFQRAVPGLIADDYMARSLGDRPGFEYSRYRTCLVEALSIGKDCAVSDITFCRAERRDEFAQSIGREVPGVQIRWIFFEKRPDLCKQNVIRRAREAAEREKRNIDELSAVYSVPEGADVRSVYSDR